MTYALRYDDVTFTYPDTATPALSDVTVALAEGTFALTIGPTGAGKSTFLRAANGLVPHFTGGTMRGHVRVGGRDTREHAPRHLADVVAFVPQDPAASFVVDRVEDELAYGMENLGVDPAHMRRRVEEALDLLDLAALRDRSVRTLSGGERQRVAIGAALAAGPRLLVLDEPTSQLDPQGAEHVMAALQRLVHDHGMTVLLAEHRLERVAGWVDVAFGIDGGRVIEGSPADVLHSLAVGPPVARLGRMIGWTPLPLTVRDARHAARAHAIPEPSAAPGGAFGAPLLTARGISVTYDRGPALRRVSVEIREGEIVALLGRNGAGKSTLLRAMAGVQTPDEGAVLAPDRPPRPGVDVTLCPQESDAILFNDTVEKEVRATLERRHVPGAAAPWLEALGIVDIAAHHPRDLSAGQRLLVATAAVAATGAPVLLLDEPTRGLDPETKERLIRFVRSHAAGGGGVVVATHDVELAAAAASRVVMLAAGEVIADGDPATVLGDSQVFAPQMTRVFGAGWLTPEQVAEALA
jgi:energy-coupling factor transport system ATP-binding protein